MQLIDTFSGIGGFSYAAQQLPNWRTVAFCEIDQFCCDVLRKNFGYKIPIHNDIKTLTRELLIKYGWDEKEETIITGGFPCQPFSNAGLKRGKDDNRYLWPSMLNLIKGIKPRFVIGENVTGIIDMVIPEIRLDLEKEGYKVELFVIPACAVGGLHRRDRIWIIAYADNEGLQGGIGWSKNGFEQTYDIFTQSLCKDENKLPEPRVIGSGNGIPNRVDRTKALGNAIVPQIAFILMFYINELNKLYK